MTFSRRHLPHWSPDGQDLFITWRLHDSLPANFRPPPNVNSSGKAFVTVDRVLDHAQTGPLWLKDSRVASAVLAALTDGQRRKLFEIGAYVLIANHVHVLLTPRAPIAQITHRIKGASAREANLIPGRTGSKFWQNESFDHWIRNPAEGESVRTYVERNPVAAGLVSQPSDWPWSSASQPIGRE